MMRLRRTLRENADWLAAVSLVLWFATTCLVICNFIYEKFPDGWTAAAGVAYVVGIASGTFARTVLTNEDRKIATTALGLYVGCSVFAVFLMVLPLGFEGG